MGVFVFWERLPVGQGSGMHHTDRPLYLQWTIPETAAVYDTDGISLYPCGISNSHPVVQQGGNTQPHIFAF